VRNAIDIPWDCKMDQQYWINKAAEARQLALATTDPVVKNELRDIADGYERIANLMREEMQPDDSPDRN
jgi:hypothetical protein